MEERNWVSNRYLRATNNNFTLAATIGNDVAAVLANRGATSPAINALNTYFEPINQLYQIRWGALDAATGVKEGASLSLKQAIDGMRPKANQWRKAIANIYDEHSPEYKTLLPDGIGPFTSGKQIAILQAMEGFATRLTPFTDLASTKTDVLAQYDILNSINSSQKGKVGARDTASDVVEATRVTLCQGLQYVEAGLTQIFIEDLSQVNAFFPLDLLRRRPQTEFTGSVNAGETKFIVERKQKDGDDVTMHNTGLGGLTFFFAPHKDTVFAPAMAHQDVPSGGYLTATATDLGASADNVYLLVKNDSDEVEGHWVVEL